MIRDFVLRCVPPVAVIGVLLALGEILARLGVLPIFLPAPTALAAEILRNPGLLGSNAVATGRTALEGYLVAAGVAALAAAGAALASAVRQPLYTTGLVMQSIPLIAAAPLLATWLGAGTELHITIAALSSQFPILVGAMQGLRASSDRQRELMHVLSASRLQTLRFVSVPMAAPYIFAGLKIAAPGAVLGAITAEWTGSEKGLGAVMLYALFSYDVIKVWIAVVATCLLAVLGYGIVAGIEWVLVFWDRPVAVRVRR